MGEGGVQEFGVVGIAEEVAVDVVGYGGVVAVEVHQEASLVILPRIPQGVGECLVAEAAIVGHELFPGDLGIAHDVGTGDDGAAGDQDRQSEQRSGPPGAPYRDGLVGSRIHGGDSPFQVSEGREQSQRGGRLERRGVGQPEQGLGVVPRATAGVCQDLGVTRHLTELSDLGSQ